MAIGPPYSVRGAARRVHRHRSTIQRWMRLGLPHRRIGTHEVEIDEDDLTSWWRETLIRQKNARFSRKDLTPTVYDHLP